jgi:hypothetical protein
MIADSASRYFDVEMRIARCLQTFVTDIKILTLPPAPKTTEIFFYVMCFSLQYTGTQY